MRNNRQTKREWKKWTKIHRPESTKHYPFLCVKDNMRVENIDVAQAIRCVPTLVQFELKFENCLNDIWILKDKHKISDNLELWLKTHLDAKMRRERICAYESILSFVGWCWAPIIYWISRHTAAGIHMRVCMPAFPFFSRFPSPTVAYQLFGRPGMRTHKIIIIITIVRKHEPGIQFRLKRYTAHTALTQ